MLRTAIGAALVAAVGVISSSALAGGRVVITEIMYNPASDEAHGESEWVEIANLGDAPVEIKDWRLDDEDSGAAADWSAFSCTLAPGSVVVLVNASAVDDAKFREAWEDGSDEAAPAKYLVMPVKWGGISNNPDGTNELLRLVDGAGTTVCEAHLRNGDGWPKLSAAGGPSIYLTDLRAVELSDGAKWKSSEAGRDGARECRKSAVFNGKDIGSPGRLPARTETASR